MKCKRFFSTNLILKTVYFNENIFKTGWFYNTLKKDRMVLWVENWFRKKGIQLIFWYAINCFVFFFIFIFCKLNYTLFIIKFNFYKKYIIFKKLKNLFFFLSITYILGQKGSKKFSKFHQGDKFNFFDVPFPVEKKAKTFVKWQYLTFF